MAVKTQTKEEEAQDSPELRRRLGILTIEELAAALATSVSTINSWRRPKSRNNPLGGSGPQFTRLGRKIYYREADVVDWIGSNVGRAWAGAEE